MLTIFPSTVIASVDMTVYTNGSH